MAVRRAGRGARQVMVTVFGESPYRGAGSSAHEPPPSPSPSPRPAAGDGDGGSALGASSGGQPGGGAGSTSGAGGGSSGVFHCADAYVTVVAVDASRGQPVQVERGGGTAGTAGGPRRSDLCCGPSRASACMAQSTLSPSALQVPFELDTSGPADSLRYRVRCGATQNATATRTVSDRRRAAPTARSPASHAAPHPCLAASPPSCCHPGGPQAAVARRAERLALRGLFAAGERSRVSLDGGRTYSPPPEPGDAGGSVLEAMPPL
jgi:hypothetical protein